MTEPMTDERLAVLYDPYPGCETVPLYCLQELHGETTRLREQVAAANAFCEVAAKMDSFDYHPLMIAWKKLQNWDENV